MNYHLILTHRCNLSCSYCGGTRDVEPQEVSYSPEALKEFLEKDSKPVLAFYGGEPLLRLDYIEKVMENLEATFVIQTNGLLLHKLKPELLKKFHTILISIDGGEEVTDKHRGRGVYRRIRENMRIIRERGFEGDLIARMTVSKDADIYRDVTHLLNLENPGFDHVHWQLDFEMFWEGNEEETLERWLKESYNPGITKLVKLWVEEMRNSRVLGMVPFLGIMGSLLRGESSKLRCGSGEYFFAIGTDGTISYCPVVSEYSFARVGSIFEGPESIKKVSVGEPCTGCEVFEVCGGRCLFVNKFKHWLGEENFSRICRSVKHLISQLERVKPEIEKLIEDGIISREDFNYPEINAGCEIIP